MSENEKYSTGALDDTGYSTLRGPDGFECVLGEPEDRTWQRDGLLVVDKLNNLTKQRDALLEACEGLVADREILEQDEGITACQCMAKAPDDITEPPPCAYCLAIAAIKLTK